MYRAVNVVEGVGLVRPLFRFDDVLNIDAVFESSIDSFRHGHDQRQFILHGKQADRFVGGGESAEEGDEDAVVSSILISDEADGFIGFDDLLHFRCRTPIW